MAAPFPFSPDLLLYIIGGILALRASWVLFSADQGRKHDLAYRSPVTGDDFEIAVLVPVRQEDDALPLQDLLTCLAAQDYPLKQTRILLLVTENAHPLKDHMTLPPNAQWITVPHAASDSTQRLLRWSLDRLMAAQAPDLFVILETDNLIKTDFLTETVSVAYRHDVFQGYMAHRDFGEGILSRSLGLQTRLKSRIHSVGRHHGGLGLLFRKSGLAFKPSVHERFPLQHQDGIGFAPWSITLNRHGVKPQWVPSMIIFERQYPDLFIHVVRQTNSALFTSILTLKRLLSFATPSELEQHLAMLPSNPMINLILLGIAVALAPQGLPGSQTAWVVLFTIQALLYVSTLAVARMAPKEWLNTTMLFLSASLLECVALPLAVVSRSFDVMANNLVSAFGFTRSRDTIKGDKERVLREAQTPEPLKKSPASAPDFPRSQPDARQAEPERPSQAKTPTIDTRQTLQLRLGKQTIHADLQVDIDSNPQWANGLLYRIQLHYKEQLFKTHQHPTLEAAFTELSNTLARFHIQPQTCGSCAYLYYPPDAEHNRESIEAGLPQQGVCLYGKKGKVLNLTNELPLHVLSQACGGHTHQAQHDKVVQEWANSLSGE